jgi:flagellar protein FliO/FliZ
MQTAFDWLSLVRMLAALAFVLALLLAAPHLLRRFHNRLRPMSGQRLRIIEALALDQRRRLLLVGCDEQQFLLLLGGESDVLLSRLSPQHERPQHERAPYDLAPTGEAPLPLTPLDPPASQLA